MNNSTLNNNLNGTFNLKETKKKTPNKYHYHNNSFNNLYNKDNFYSKPVARLKKRIFDSSSDQKIDNSISGKNENISLNKSDFQEKDSLEMNQKEINNNIIKELLITIKTLNQIINTQKKIIEEQMIKLKAMNYEIEEKEKETKNYKQICLKLMFYLKEEKELNILNEKNQRRNIIENQIIKENKILRKLFINKPVNRNSTNHNIRTINSLIQQKSFFNIHYKSKDKANTEHSSDNGRMNTFENNDNDKKRNKSYERINDKYSEILITKNIKKLIENKDSNFKYIKLREKNHKYIGENDDIINIKPGKKIKYLVKDKNNLSLEFENICHNNNI